MRSRAAAMMAAFATLSYAIPLDVNSTDSIRNASGTLAYGLQTWYTANQSDTAPTAIGTLPQPLYWWEAGAMWGGMVDYWAYTNDTSYVEVVQQALLAQVGPDNNFMNPNYYSSLGNDDQAFWAITVLSALEYEFPAPAGSQTLDGKNLWLQIAENVFNTMVPRWNTTTCNGGLKWQIFPANPNGFTYKNSISNGGLFQIAARLARYTGNSTYEDWANKVYDWMYGVNLIDNQNFNVFDGTSDGDNLNCSEVDHTAWSYNPSMMLLGSAMMYNYTNGSSVWERRAVGFLTSCASIFFSPFDNSTNVMYEYSCEPRNICNNDQLSFKAYLARWMAKSAIVAPLLKSEVTMLLKRSAVAAAQACSGSGIGGTACGTRWYVNGYDGLTGVGQQMSALETVQALLLLNDSEPINKRWPITGPNVRIQQAPPVTSTLVLPSATGAVPDTRGASNAANRPGIPWDSLGFHASRSRDVKPASCIGCQSQFVGCDGYLDRFTRAVQGWLLSYSGVRVCSTFLTAGLAAGGLLVLW